MIDPESLTRYLPKCLLDDSFKSELTYFLKSKVIESIYSPKLIDPTN